MCSLVQIKKQFIEKHWDLVLDREETIVFASITMEYVKNERPAEINSRYFGQFGINKDKATKHWNKLIEYGLVEQIQKGKDKKSTTLWIIPDILPTPPADKLEVFNMIGFIGNEVVVEQAIEVKVKTSIDDLEKAMKRVPTFRQLSEDVRYQTIHSLINNGLDAEVLLELLEDMRGAGFNEEIKKTPASLIIYLIKNPNKYPAIVDYRIRKAKEKRIADELRLRQEQEEVVDYTEVDMTVVDDDMFSKLLQKASLEETH